MNVARGSAMRVLLDEVLCELEARPESVRGYDREVASPDAVAAFVAKGAAEAGVGHFEPRAGDLGRRFPSLPKRLDRDRGEEK